MAKSFTGSGPSTARGQISRQRIISESMQLFYSMGFANVTFDMIAKKCGMTQPALYKYFADKLDLLTECTKDAALAGRQFIAQRVDPFSLATKQLEAYVHANLSWLSDHPEQTSCLLSLYFFANTSKKVDSMRIMVETNGIQSIALILSQGCNSKLWKIDDGKLMIVARQIHSLLVGEIFKVMCQRKTKRNKKTADEIILFLRHLLKYN